MVQTASRNDDGSFPPGVTVGRAIGGTSPALAVSAGGDQMLVWHSGQAVRSAFRRAGARTWQQETVVPSGSAVHFVMASSGRGVAAWIAIPDGPGGRDSLFVSTHPAGGAWSRPVVLATLVQNLSLASDSAGDVVVEYEGAAEPTGPAAIWAAALPASADAWSAPEVISGSDPPRYGNLVVAGGGARTFVARWKAIDFQASSPQSATRSARLQLPGTWSAPRDLVPGSTRDSAHFEDAIAVDGLGNATSVWQFATSGLLYGLGVASLPSSAEEWTPAAELDRPARGDWSDSPASFAFGRDGSGTLAFVRGGRNDYHVVVASAHEPLGPWRGGRVASLPVRDPCKSLTCSWEWKVQPVLAVAGGQTTVVVQSRKRAIVAFTQVAPGARWNGPVKLRSAGRTTVFLPCTRVREGVVRFRATCSLPPCVGVVELRDAETDEQFGRARLVFRSSSSERRRFLLPVFARERLTRGEQLRVKLSYDAVEGDGTKEHLLLITHLHDWNRG